MKMDLEKTKQTILSLLRGAGKKSLILLQKTNEVFLPLLNTPNTLFLILLLVPFCKPSSLEYYPWPNRLFQLWKIASLVYLACALLPPYLKQRPKDILKGLPKGILGLGVFWLVYLLGCLYSGAEIVSISTAAAGCGLLLLLIFYEVRLGNGMQLLRAMTWLFTACILCHVLSVFFVSWGWLRFDPKNSGIYLYGYDNYSAFFLYPMLCVILFYSNLRYNRISLWCWGLLLTVAFINIYTKSVAAAGVGILLILLFLFKKYWPRLGKFLQARYTLIALAFFLVLICVFHVQNLLAFLLDKLGKGVTLNSRTIIWDHALRLFIKRPLLGYGAFTAQQIKNYILYGTTHAHNVLLELLIRTGLVGTVGYLRFLCGFAKKERALYDTKADVLLIGLIVQLVLSFMDFYPTILVFYCFMGCLYNADSLCAEATKNPAEPAKRWSLKREKTL